MADEPRPNDRVEPPRLSFVVARKRFCAGGSRANRWGCSGPCFAQPVVEEAIRLAGGLGAVVVFAAGNNADDVFNDAPQDMKDRSAKPPVVAANDRFLRPARFGENAGTNYGATVDVSAPGGGEQTLPNVTYSP